MKKNGFEQMLSELRDKVSHFNNPKRIIETMITLDGKVDFEVGLQSLNFEQLAIYQHLDGATCVFTEAPPPSQERAILFGMTEYGRLLLGKSNFYDAYTKVWGYIMISSVTMQAIEQEIKRLYAQEFSLYQQEVVPFYQHLNAQDVVKVIEAIKNKIDFMAPILLYYNEQTFTTFYHYNNLLESLEGDTTKFLLDDLAKQDVRMWTPNERTFIFNMYAILQSGPPARGEEVNGVHFSLIYLSQYFKNKLLDYQQMAEDVDVGHQMSLLTQAQTIFKLREQVVQHYLIYRRINGLNLHKQEAFLTRKKLITYTDKMLERALKSMLEVTTYQSQYDAFYQYIEKHPNVTAIQQVIETIVSYAIEGTNADMGMTRSFRQPLTYYHALKNKHIETICDWNQKKYFCCVIPSQSMLQAFQKQRQMLSGILIAISKRMEYNSWHYTPGNFLDLHPHMTRHYYFPPVMSDITEWSNQHHKGHVFANVKYAIRCPGTIQCPPHQLNAFYDLRLMRSSGKAFSENDLVKALYYQRMLGSLYQAWFDFGMNTQYAIDMTAYDRTWYQREYQQVE